MRARPCGTIFGGTREIITFQSSPTAAQVTTIPPTASYTTPSSVALQRKNSYLLTFEADGYHPGQFAIQNEMRTGILIADILLTGLIGVVVDGLTGGLYRLEPKTAVVTLAAAGDDAALREDITIALSIQDDEDVRTVELQASSPGVSMNVVKLAD